MGIAKHKYMGMYDYNKFSKNKNKNLLIKFVRSWDAIQ